MLLAQSSRSLLRRVPACAPIVAERSLLRRPIASTSTRYNNAPAPTPPPIVGTAPQMDRHLLIHTPPPTSSWPSHLDSTSPLYRQLAQRWNKHPQLSKLGFGITDGANGSPAQPWDRTRNKFDEPPSGPPETYSATLYPDFIDVPSLSLASIEAFETQYLALPPAPSGAVSASAPKAASDRAPRTHIFVCTHATRDCRCGDLGEPLYTALVREIQRRKVPGGELRDGSDGIRVARVAHIGGHKWAANALVYREGGGCDWYGLLRAEDAPRLIDLALAPASSPLSSTPWYTRWRGRIGLTPADVRAAYAERPAEEARAQGKADEPRHELGERVELVFTTFEGAEVRAVGYEGESVMEVAKRHDLPSILATCGGHCECATCHVHLAEDAPQPEMKDEEDEQLEFAIGADDDSRLACQLPVTKELGEWVTQGGRIRLPRY